MDKFKIFIIGLGNIGLLYDLILPKNYVLSHTRAFHISNNFEILGVIDNNLKHKDFFKNYYAYPYFNSIDEAFKNFNPDGIIISTPPETHLDIISSVIKFKSISFIVCEKPFTNSLENSIKANKLCIKNKIKLFVNYQRNSSIITRQLLSDLNNNVIKGPIKINHWYSDGLENSCSHFISLFNQLFGEINNISMFNKKKSCTDKKEFVLEYENAEIVFRNLSYPYVFNGFKLFASNGILEYLNNGIEVNWYGLMDSKVNYPKKKIIGKKNIYHKNDFFTSQKSFTVELFKTLTNQNSYISTGHDAIYVRNIINKLII